MCKRTGLPLTYKKSESPAKLSAKLHYATHLKKHKAIALFLKSQRFDYTKRHLYISILKTLNKLKKVCFK
ncbi:MAG: hypothetical protein A2W17_01815 [Planctomycetes bacterium RBG_16_41_13]|nr:MAG: hypothetical protein A2W17_01815 [Planctomycetes bacterium RBG_16_41_13]